MMKKRMDQRGGANGIEATALGYAINAKPGPINKKRYRIGYKIQLIFTELFIFYSLILS